MTCLTQCFEFAIRIAHIPVQLLFYISNAMCIIVGAICMILGSTTIHDIADLSLPIASAGINFTLVPILLTIMGVTILAICILGYCGTCLKSKQLLQGYVAAMVVILLLQIGLGIHAINKYPDDDTQHITQSLTDAIKMSIKSYKGSKEMHNTLNYMQKKLECCGADGPSDWHHPQDSCCNNDVADCTVSRAYSAGCGVMMYGYIQSKIGTIGTFALALTVFELFGIVVAFILLIKDYNWSICSNDPDQRVAVVQYDPENCNCNSDSDSKQ